MTSSKFCAYEGSGMARLSFARNRTLTSANGKENHLRSTGGVVFPHRNRGASRSTGTSQARSNPLGVRRVGAPRRDEGKSGAAANWALGIDPSEQMAATPARGEGNPSLSPSRPSSCDALGWGKRATPSLGQDPSGGPNSSDRKNEPAQPGSGGRDRPILPNQLYRAGL
jgi:hypothetical protein